MIVSYFTWNNEIISFSCKKILVHAVFELILILYIYKNWSVNSVCSSYSQPVEALCLLTYIVNELAHVSLWA